jgi:7-keto-8-aminopelargonate synthetase-like enzyme
MRSSLQKLVRLAKVHNQIVDWHLENITHLAEGLAECDALQNRTLQSMEQLQRLGIAKGPNFSRILQEMQVRRSRLKAAAQSAKSEHARISAIVEKLEERQAGLRERVDQEQLEETIEEWNIATSTFS